MLKKENSFLEKIVNCNVDIIDGKVTAITMLGQPMLALQLEKNTTYKEVARTVAYGDMQMLVAEKVPETVTGSGSDDIFEMAVINDEIIKKYVGFDIPLEDMLAIILNEIMKQNNLSSMDEILNSGILTVNQEIKKDDKDDVTEEYINSRARVILCSICENSETKKYEISPDCPEMTYLVKYQAINKLDLATDPNINKLT